jgi:predicted N-acetyltransferase YhbS
VLALLAREEAAFDVEGRGTPRPAVAGGAAETYLTHPDVLHWVAEEDGTVVGHLLCYVQHRRAGEERQLLLYDIGVREAYRRRGIGRTLIAELDRWLRENGVRDVWVVADKTAVGFYAASGFIPDESSVVMSRRGA